jgi:hypothetical protein
MRIPFATALVDDVVDMAEGHPMLSGHLAIFKVFGDDFDCQQVMGMGVVDFDPTACRRAI